MKMIKSHTRWAAAFNTEAEADYYIGGLSLEPKEKVSTRLRTVRVDGVKKEMPIPVYHFTDYRKVFDNVTGKWIVSCEEVIKDQLQINEDTENRKSSALVNAEKAEKYYKQQALKETKTRRV